jgi:hypothetical protein
MLKEAFPGERRYAERFPLHLPLTVRGIAENCHSQTCDISSGGLLFYADNEMEPGSPIELTVIMPGKALGRPNDVPVNCSGRVVRCYPQEGRHAVAVVIDEYAFERPDQPADRS